MLKKIKLDISVKEEIRQKISFAYGMELCLNCLNYSVGQVQSKAIATAEAGVDCAASPTKKLKSQSYSHHYCAKRCCH